jgi:hypothetical protein
MYAQKLRPDDPEYLLEEYSGTTAYARSKRTQVELLGILQSRWSGTNVYAVHPGWARTPGVSESLPGFARLTAPILRTTESGGDTTAWLAAVQPAPPGGGLWHDRRQRATTYLGRNATTEEDRVRMWEWVRSACGLEPTVPG